jgi:hypothetical protein
MKLHVIALIAAAAGFAGVYGASNLTRAPVAAPQAPAPTLEQVKATAREIPYDAFAREPGKFVGAAVALRGKVIQVMEDGSGVTMRINVTPTSYGGWKDTVLVSYRRASKAEPRVLDDDVVRFWGRFSGMASYKAVMGQTITVPRVVASIIEPALETPRDGRGALRR